MEILTYKKVYQLVGDNTSGTNECITKSAAMQIAESHRKNVTSNLSQYLNNEYIDVFAIEDKPDLSTFSFANNRYNPQAAGNTYTTAVSSRDIDGNTIEYNATADVDWITDIVINSTEIRFKVTANMGDQRIGHINGSNVTGNSDTITIIQEAKEANLVYTYSLIATCESVPTVTINGIAITSYTTAGNSYTFQYTTRVRTESEAPESVGFTISGGGSGDTYNEGTLSVSPTSWYLNDGLSKQFTVGYSRVKTTKAWDHATGTIVRNGSTNVSLNTTTATEYPTIDYTISDTHPSGQSFSHSKDGMNFTSAASSTSCTGSIIVTYGSLSATANVFYTETVYDKYTYTVKASDTNTSNTPTITINGHNAIVTHSDGYYVGKITISDSATTSAPDSVSWSISGGTKDTEWNSYNISLSPDSWNLDDSLTKQFSVSMYQSGTKYSWRTSSGTVAKNGEASTDVTSSSTSYTGNSYSVSGPSGMTFSKNGASFTATASSTESIGTITVTCTESNANGESASCNVIYNPALKSWTYTVNVTCPERPTITIGGEDATVTGDSNNWVGTRVIVSQNDPGEKRYSVTAGSNSRTWGDVHVSVSPSSIAIKEKPADISFTAYAYQEYEDYTPYTASGTTSNKRAACKPTRSHISGESEGEMCSISASNVSGLSGSMQISKYGTTISGTANGSGSVTVTQTYYDHNTDHTYRDSATCDIIYEEETFPDWTNDMYVFGWGMRGGESVLKTSISCKFDPVTFKPNDLDWVYYTIVSYRSRTGSNGTVQKESVGYTGNNQTSPNSPNTTGQVISESGELVQNGSGKSAQWSWTQDSKPEDPVLGPFYRWKNGNSMSFTTSGGKQSLTYQQYYTKGGVEQDVTDKTVSLTKDILYSTDKASGTETVSDTGLSYTWEQDANSRITSSGLNRIVVESGNLSSGAGSVELFYTFDWNWKIGTGGDVVASGRQTFSYGENTNTTQRNLTFTKSYPGASSGKNDYGLSYPDATCTIIQDGSATPVVNAVVSASGFPLGTATANVGVSISPSVPFTVTVSGIARAKYGTAWYNSNYSITVPANSSDNSTTVSFSNSITGIPTEVDVNVNSISPSDKTIGNTRYILST